MHTRSNPNGRQTSGLYRLPRSYHDTTLSRWFNGRSSRIYYWGHRCEWQHDDVHPLATFLGNSENHVPSDTIGTAKVSYRSNLHGRGESLLLSEQDRRTGPHDDIHPRQ